MKKEENSAGAWRPTEERRVKSPIVERQKEVLLKLKGLLEAQIESDLLKIAEAHASVQKIRNGGG